MYVYTCVCMCMCAYVCLCMYMCECVYCFYSVFLSGLAASIRTIKDPADFLSPPSRAVFDMELIHSTLDKLTPSNGLVFIGSWDFGKIIPQGLRKPYFDMVEPWSGITFDAYDDDTYLSSISSWRIDNDTVKLSLPPENDFIPKALDVHPLDKNHSGIPTQINKDNGKE